MRVNGNLDLMFGGFIQNLRADIVAVDPATPASGQVWFNTADSKLRFFDGVVVQTIGDSTSTINYINSQISTLQTSLTAETAARQAADTALQTQVSNLETSVGTDAQGVLPSLTGTYTTGAASLLAAVNALDSALSSASSTSSSGLAAETAARQAADTTLTNNLAAEVTARQNADTALQSAIDAEVAARQAADASEAARAAAAETAISDSLNRLIAAVGENSDGSFKAFSGTNYVDAATSVYNALTLLDTQVKSNSDSIATLNTQFSGIDAALQAELDRLEAATGVNTDGSFVPFTGANYVGAVSSVRAGIVTLDGALKSVSDAGDNEVTRATAAEAGLQAEVDAIEAGAGLAAGGAYVVLAGSNYLTAATSLSDADSKLDAAIKALSDNVATITGSNLTQITSDITALQTGLANEISARQAADTALGVRIDDLTTLESTHYTTTSNAITALQSSLAAQVSKEQTDVDNLTAAIAALQTSTTNDLNAAISTLTNRVAGDEAELGYVKAYVGKDSNGGTMPAYSSVNFIANNDSLTTAAGKLDAAIQTAVTNINTTITTLSSNSSVGALYVSGSALASHTFTHNLGYKYGNVTIVDSTDNVVIPQSITFTDTNSLVVTFNAPVQCKIVFDAVKV